MCFSHIKVVLTHMLCPYQFQGGRSPVFCDVHNAQKRKGKRNKQKNLKVLQNYYKMEKKVLSEVEWHFKQ